MTPPTISARRRDALRWVSPSMRDVEADVVSALTCDLNVMITGENGVGKRSIANRIHPRGTHSRNGCVIEDAERMSPGFQSRLLAYIEQQPAPPAAGRHVRFITVANSSLFDLVRCDEFCEPLFYRLNTIHVMIPPLRDRPGDIPVLLRHFMSTAGQLRPARLTPAAWQRLMTYEWPGNIPELREVADALIALRIERAIDLPDLPAALKPPFDM